MTYSFKLSEHWGLLSIEHRGKFQGAETDEAVVSILRDMPLPQRRNVRRIGVDLRNVDFATLQDTDGARVRRSERLLQELLQLTSEDYAEHLKGMNLIGWIDLSAPVQKILDERMIRVERNIKFGSTGVCTTKEEYLRLLNLPPDFDLSE